MSAETCSNCGGSITVYDPTCCHVLGCEPCRRIAPRTCARNVSKMRQMDRDREIEDAYEKGYADGTADLHAATQKALETFASTGPARDALGPVDGGAA